MREIHFIKVPPVIDLLREMPKFQQEVHRAIGESSKPLPILILLPHAISSGNDFSPQSLANFMYDELYPELQKFYQLLQDIRAAKIPVIFFGRDDCFSILCEMALACHLRIWQNQNGHVGFPEARIGAIAPSLFDLKSRNPQLIAPWHDAPIISTTVALNRGIIETVMSLEQLQGFLANCTEGTVSSWLSRARSNVLTGQVHEKGQIQLYCQSMLNDQTRLSAARHPIPTEGPSSIQSLVIFDISFALPPTSSLVRALQRSAKIVFTANDSLSLTSGLETIYGRLQRALAPQQFSFQWNHQIIWTSPSELGSSYPIFHWLSEDTLDLHIGKESIELALSSGPDVSSARDLPVCEVLHGKTSVSAMNFIYLITNQIIQAHPVEGLSLTQYLRLTVLCEICRIAKQSDGKLLTVCDNLRKSGWSVVGNDIFWQRFLVAPEISTHPMLKSLIGKSSEYPAVSWRELVQWCELKSSKGLRPSWSALAVSQHLAIFVWYQIREHIIPKLEVDASAALQNIWQWSIPILGFPLAYGTPLQYALSWNQRRIDHTIRTYWSHDTNAISPTHS